MSTTVCRTRDYSLGVDDDAALRKWSVDVQIHEQLYDNAVSMRARYGWQLPIASPQVRGSVPIARQSTFSMNSPFRTRIQRLLLVGSIACFIAAILGLVVMSAESFTPSMGILVGATTAILLYEMWLLARRGSRRQQR